MLLWSMKREGQGWPGDAGAMVTESGSDADSDDGGGGGLWGPGEGPQPPPGPALLSPENAPTSARQVPISLLSKDVSARNSKCSL